MKPGALRRRAAAFLTVIGVTAGLLVAASGTAVAGGISLQIDQWDRSVDSALVTYDVTLEFTGAAAAGQPCASWCSWSIPMTYRDGSTEIWRGSLAAGRTTAKDTFSTRVQGSAVQMTEITHIRALLTADYDTTAATYSTAWMEVSLPYPEGYVDLEVHTWDVGTDGRTTTYDVTLSWAGAAQADGPCVKLCRWRVDLYSGSTYVGGLGGGATSTRGIWAKTVPMSGTTAPNLPVTELRAILAPYSSPSPYKSYEYSVAVSGSVFADVDLDPYVHFLAGVPRAELCKELTFYPVNTDTDSPPEPLEACEAAVAAGASLKTILKRVAIEGGVLALDMMVEPGGGPTAPIEIVRDEPEPDPEAEPQPEPEPAVAPAAPPVLPPTNCLSDAERAALLEVRDYEDHHIVTNKHPTLWTPIFERLLLDVGLSLDGSWNMIRIRHRGRHAGLYHQWIHANLERIIDRANGDVEAFLRMWKPVRDAVAADSLIVTSKWWACQ